jgi:hypothetical protein
MGGAVMKRFEIRYEICEELAVDQIWPDGDAPENASADDVRKLLGRDAHRTLADWDLDHGDVSVREVETGPKWVSNPNEPNDSACEP